MQYAIARGVFTSLKWFWLAFLAVFAVTYAANVAPLPFKQVTHQFYDSTFGMLFLPGLHLTLRCSRWARWPCSRCSPG